MNLNTINTIKHISVVMCSVCSQTMHAGIIQYTFIGVCLAKQMKCLLISDCSLKWSLTVFSSADLTDSKSLVSLIYD